MAPAVLNSDAITKQLKSIVQESRTLVISDVNTSETQKIVEVLKSHGENPVIENWQNYTQRDGLSTRLLQQLTGRNTCNFPLLFIKGDFVGGYEELHRLEKSGALKSWLEQHDYDLIVIGGGSGGLAAAKEVAGLGKKVALLDYVEPTPIGTSWGLGGTCVNVGCIPKKLMHQGALLGKAVNDARNFGWSVSENFSHDWQKMRDAVQDYIGSLNWGYRVTLREKDVTYLNAKGSFAGQHQIKAVNKRGKEQLLTADRFLISVGLRPRYMDIPGAKEYCITSDDVFSLSYNPGPKILVVGASYVALECAGFLRGIGCEVTVMVRSILLRGFDQDMAERIGKYMENEGVRFIHETIPVNVERLEEGQPGLYRVTAQSNDGQTIVDEYNTVLLGIGRDAITDPLNLEIVGVERNMNEQSSVPYVYAIGDVLDGKQELTPVAIQAGRLWAHRLFGESYDQCDYDNVPTTVFTPIEYGCCGLSEEDAIAKYGAENIIVYHNRFRPLEFTIPKRDQEACYGKLVCRKDDNLRVIGFHVLGPNAGEITQGFAIALKLNATKADFDRLIGIHPTNAEVFTTMNIIKSGDQEIQSTGC